MDYKKLSKEIQWILWDGFRIRHCAEDSDAEDCVELFKEFLIQYKFTNVTAPFNQNI